jgi:hypothetical protein
MSRMFNYRIRADKNEHPPTCVRYDDGQLLDSCKRNQLFNWDCHWAGLVGQIPAFCNVCFLKTFLTSQRNTPPEKNKNASHFGGLAELPGARWPGCFGSVEIHNLNFVCLLKRRSVREIARSLPKTRIERAHGPPCCTG